MYVAWRSSIQLVLLTLLLFHPVGQDEIVSHIPQLFLSFPADDLVSVVLHPSSTMRADLVPMKTKPIVRQRTILMAVCRGPSLHLVDSPRRPLRQVAPIAIGPGLLSSFPDRTQSLACRTWMLHGASIERRRSLEDCQPHLPCHLQMQTEDGAEGEVIERSNQFMRRTKARRRSGHRVVSPIGASQHIREPLVPIVNSGKR